MQWFGKAIGAALGMAFLGPWGAAIGAVLGHQFDQGLGSPLAGASQAAQRAFFATTFEVMGHVAKVDGRVSEEEIQVARRIMHGMHLGPDQVREAIAYFTAGKRGDYPLQRRLDDLARSIGSRQQLARAFVEIQMQAAVGAGEIAQSKRELLWRIARSFGVDRVDLARIEAMLRARQTGARMPDRQLDLGDAYRTLGVEPGVTDKEVKTAYRRLMNEHHPDKLVAKGLPESMTAVAEERTQQIRAAYDRIKADRGFK
jgi:DnaJ like chaperone protein